MRAWVGLRPRIGTRRPAAHPLARPPRARGSGALWRHTGPSHAPLGTAGMFERLFFRLEEEQQVLVYFADDHRLTASRNRPLGTPTPAPVPPGAVHPAP